MEYIKLNINDKIGYLHLANKNQFLYNANSLAVNIFNKPYNKLFTYQKRYIHKVLNKYVFG